MSRRALLGAAAATAMLPRRARARGGAPEAFGAVGDGQSDDTAALRRWLDADLGEHRLTGGRTYLVRPSRVGDVILPVRRRGLRLLGDGALIRVAERTPGFGAILGSLAPAEDLSGLDVRGIQFDHAAPATLPFAVRDGVLTEGRHTVAVRRGADIAFTGNTVSRAATTNAVYVNGDGFTSRVIVAHNRFERVGRTPNRVYHDHSTLYLTGDGLRAENNVFIADGWGNEGSVCAIEVHPGRGCTVKGNTITGFHTGINYAAVYETDSIGGVVEGNTLDVLRRGIAIYSIKYLMHVAGWGVDGLRIDANRIRLRNATPQGRMSGGGPGCFGIATVGGATLPVRDLVIGGGNRIIFDNDAQGQAWDGISYGVGIGETTTDALFDQVHIGDLEITDAPVMGIALGQSGGTLGRCTVGRPTIVRPASTKSMRLVSDYRSAMWISPRRLAGSVRVEGARVIDETGGSRLHSLVFVSAPVADAAAVIDVALDARLGGRAPQLAHPVVVLPGRAPRVRLTTDLAVLPRPFGSLAPGSASFFEGRTEPLR